MSKPKPLKFNAPLGYRIAFVWSWLFLTVVFSFVLVSDIRDGVSSDYTLAKIAAACVSILLVMGVFLFNHISKTITIKNDSIYYSSLLKSVQVRLNEVKGYESSRYNVIIISHNTAVHSKIRITKNFPLNEWLSNNLTYLGLGWF